MSSHQVAVAINQTAVHFVEKFACQANSDLKMNAVEVPEKIDSVEVPGKIDFVKVPGKIDFVEVAAMELPGKIAAGEVAVKVV